MIKTILYYYITPSVVCMQHMTLPHAVHCLISKLIIITIAANLIWKRNQSRSKSLNSLLSDIHITERSHTQIAILPATSLLNNSIVAPQHLECKGNKPINDTPGDYLVTYITPLHT